MSTELNCGTEDHTMLRINCKRLHSWYPFLLLYSGGHAQQNLLLRECTWPCGGSADDSSTQPNSTVQHAVLIWPRDVTPCILAGRSSHAWVEKKKVLPWALEGTARLSQKRPHCIHGRHHAKTDCRHVDPEALLACMCEAGRHPCVMVCCMTSELTTE